MYTGGEEKAIRTFEAPLVVLEGLSKLAGSQQARELLDRVEGTADCKDKDSFASHTRCGAAPLGMEAVRHSVKWLFAMPLVRRVKSAYIPELGLSNRAASLMTDTEAKEQVGNVNAYCYECALVLLVLSGVPGGRHAKVGQMSAGGPAI